MKWMEVKWKINLEIFALFQGLFYVTQAFLMLVGNNIGYFKFEAIKNIYIKKSNVFIGKYRLYLCRVTTVGPQLWNTHSYFIISFLRNCLNFCDIFSYIGQCFQHAKTVLEIENLTTLPQNLESPLKIGIFLMVSRFCITFQ